MEQAVSFEDLENSGPEVWQGQLDAKLSAELDKISSGEFRKMVQVKETALSDQWKMIRGRQVAWMIYKHFKLSEEDGAMLEWDELLHVHLRGDNLQQFENDWNNTILNIRELPDEVFLATLFRKQLDKSEQLKNAMALYQQDYTQRGERKSYQKLKDILRFHLEKDSAGQK